MAAKKKRNAAAPRGKPKKRAGRPVKKKKASTKPKVRPAADILDNTPPPFRPSADDNTPPPPFRPSQPSSMHWDNSSTLEVAAQIGMWPQNRNAVLLATVGAVEPPAPLAASDPNVLHAEMIKQIEALERAMADLREHQQHGIGHNNPPEPIELTPPLSTKELDEIRVAMAVLKKQPPAPITPSTEATAAVSRLTKFARATVTYVGKQADIFATEVAKEAGKEAGKRIVQSPLWLPIIHQLPALADIAHQWLQSLGPPL
jgi:hypothetical protein